MKKEFLVTVDTASKEILDSCLSDYSLEELALLNDEVKKVYFDKLLEEQYDEAYNSTCPVCGRTHISKAGKNEKKEKRYKCVDCKKCFLKRSNTLMYWSHLSQEQ